jgi:protein-L-isoaspartate(D-aspartate) O-methyltransferase
VFSWSFCSFEESIDTYALLRMEMVKQQLISRNINDPDVLDAMGKVPRHLFIDPKYRNQAYQDFPLPIDERQTISQPYIVALMIQHLGLKEGERVLEIGTGSGYQAAVLACLTQEVYSIEIIKALADKSAATLKKLGYDYVKVKWGDGHFGWEEYAPFDAIIVACATDHVPTALMEQLKEGGRLILPLGDTQNVQTLTLIEKQKGKPYVRNILSVRFVPMTNETGKKRDKSQG